MKTRGRKPTRRQKEYMSGAGLAAENWLVENEDGESLYLVNKSSRKSRRIPKSVRKCRTYGKF